MRKGQRIHIRAALGVQEIHEDETSENGEGYRRVGEYNENHRIAHSI